MRTASLLWITVTIVTRFWFPSESAASRLPQQRSDCLECDRVVTRLLALLPKQPERVVVIDLDRSSPALRQASEHVEGFVTNGNRTVYLTKQSAIMQKALGGPGIWDYALAITVWHEMAHLDGADEREAQLREESLWQEFIVQRRVDAYQGLNYLRLLRKRDEQANASAATSPRPGLPVPAQVACRECDRVVDRVLQLLPERPDAILVTDTDRATPGLRQAIEDSEGFSTEGQRTVYLRKQAPLFRRALQGASVWDYALACVVWHEMAHIAGASELEAQRREEELLTQFIVSWKVDPTWVWRTRNA